MDIVFKKAVMNVLLSHRKQNQTNWLPYPKKKKWSGFQKRCTDYTYTFSIPIFLHKHISSYNSPF